MRFRSSLLAYLLTFLSITPLFAAWELSEETSVKGKISGTIKKGSVIAMQSGSIYEVTDLTLQLVLEISPEALVLSNGPQFKLSIKGFAEPLICKQLTPPAVGNAAIRSRHRSVPPIRSTSLKDVRLDILMTPAQQQLIGIKKLTPEERERLRQYLIILYLQGVEQREEKNPLSTSLTPTPDSTVTAASAATAIENTVMVTTTVGREKPL